MNCWMRAAKEYQLIIFDLSANENKRLRSKIGTVIIGGKNCEIK